jgi:glycosyltransferase involved in cell wall biosynthesis
MPIALVTNYLTAYRLPLYERLATAYDLEVLCFGGGERYVPTWFADLESQLSCAMFPARRLGGLREALRLGRRYDAVIAPFAGGPILPAAYLGAKRYGRPFILWASVWAQPRSLTHAVSLPAVRHIYRHADAVVAYGEHVKRFVTAIRGNETGVFIAPQAVEAELFSAPIDSYQIDRFRTDHQLAGPLVLYVGRLVPEKGIDVLLDAWSEVRQDATLALVGEGPLADRASATPRTRVIGPLPRAALPLAYATAEVVVLPSPATPRFREPWGLVCNEAMHRGRPLVVTAAVGAAAGGLVRDGVTGLVVAPGDSRALAQAIDGLLDDPALRGRLGAAGRVAVGAFNYDAMADGFHRAISTALPGAQPRSADHRAGWPMNPGSNPR